MLSLVYLSFIISSFFSEDCTNAKLSFSTYKTCVNSQLQSSMTPMDETKNEFKNLFSNMPYYYQLSNLSDTQYSLQQYDLPSAFNSISGDTPFDFLQSAVKILRNTYDTNNVIVPDYYKDYSIKLEYDVVLSTGTSYAYQLSGTGAYDGYIIVKINGEDPKTAISKFASEEVRERSPLARWNLAVKHFFNRPLTLYALPDSETITLTIRNPAEDDLGAAVDFQWFVTKQSAESNTAKSESSSARANPAVDFVTFDSEDANVEGGYYNSNNIGNVGLLRIKAFAASDTASSTGRCKFARSINSILSKLTGVSAGSLFIDLRSTGGDDLALANSLFRHLWPSQYPISPKQDFQLSDIGKLEAEWLRSSGKYEWIQDYDGTTVLSHLATNPWYKRYSDKTVPFSHPYALKTTYYCDEKTEKVGGVCDGIISRSGYTLYGPESLYIIVDGIASPVAAQFIHHVSESKLAWVYADVDTSAVGSSDAFVSVAPSAAFPMTSTHLMNDLLYEVTHLKNLYFSFAFAESYSFDYKRRSDPYGLGLIVNTPDRSMPYVSTISDFTVQHTYARAYQHTDSDLSQICMPWMVLRSSYCERPGNNQWTGRKCIGSGTDSTWDREGCTFAGCDRGYYVNYTIMTHCRPTPDYPWQRAVPEGTSYAPATPGELEFQSTVFIIGLVLLILVVLYLCGMLLAGCAVKAKQ